VERLWGLPQPSVEIIQGMARGGVKGSVSRPEWRSRRRVAWMLGGLAALVGVIGLIGAFVGYPASPQAAPKGQATSKSHSGSTPADAVLLRRAGGAYGGWRLRLVAADLDANQYLGYEQRAIPAKSREIMVALAATYSGAGYARVIDLTRRIDLSGSHEFYSADGGDLGCASRASHLTSLSQVRPLNESNPEVMSGQTVRGLLCFQIAANDAASLALTVDPPWCKNSAKVEKCSTHRWFALRK
jgi:hypothetical protein